MAEKIEIYYRPVGGGLEYFDHAFLLYTNSDGEKFVFSGMPESQAEEVDYDGEGLGRLLTDFEPLTQASYDYGSTLDTAQDVEKYTIAVGQDLSDSWNAVGEVSRQINQANIKYGGFVGTGNNSNSAVNTAVIAAGYSVPLNWQAAPGIVNDLSYFLSSGPSDDNSSSGSGRVYGALAEELAADGLDPVDVPGDAYTYYAYYSDAPYATGLYSDVNTWHVGELDTETVFSQDFTWEADLFAPSVEEVIDDGYTEDDLSATPTDPGTGDGSDDDDDDDESSGGGSAGGDT